MPLGRIGRHLAPALTRTTRRITTRLFQFACCQQPHRRITLIVATYGCPQGG
jgi:hypothetical protein